MKFEDTLKHPLDPWQKEALESMDKRHSVFAAVPTGSGKTIVAEYAAFISDKIIYTAPIKAISNQKYYDFKKKFDDVGIITGDVQMNENAKMTIMTTEILRKMLGVNDPRLNDVDWIIFDEMHYLSDEARGTVWEEIFILLPDRIRCVFLSATVPNANEFASWFSSLHKHPVDVFSIHKRPVPLTFHVAANNELHDVDVFDTIKNNEPTIVDDNLVKLLQKKELLPAIVFSCNKNRIETVARRLARQGAIVDSYRSNLIKKEFDDLLKKVNPADDFYTKYRNYAIEGVGVHHAGMVPYCKEIVERLFCDGLLPILISTETFAMGVNGPARAVVFESLKKFDGREHRTFEPHEFVQMAGRAGRRGFDTKGSVILLHDPAIPRGVVNKLVNGKPRPLRSAMRVSPTVVLQCVQRRLDMNSIFESSFESFSSVRPSKDDIRQAIAYDDMVSAWQFLLRRKELVKMFEGKMCVDEDGTLHKIGTIRTSDVVKVLDVDVNKIRSKDFDVMITVKKLKRGDVEKPPTYEDVLRFLALDTKTQVLRDDALEIYKWLEYEKLIENGTLTPLGEIACQVSGMCPVLAAKILDDSVSDIDIVRTIALFPSETTESVGDPVRVPYPEYGPERVDWRLVRSCEDWYKGRALDVICREHDLYEGNVFQCLTNVRNILRELISAHPTPRLQDILERIDRDELKIQSLYISSR